MAPQAASIRPPDCPGPPSPPCSLADPPAPWRRSFAHNLFRFFLLHAGLIAIALTTFKAIHLAIVAPTTRLAMDMDLWIGADRPTGALARQVGSMTRNDSQLLPPIQTRHPDLHLGNAQAAGCVHSALPVGGGSGINLTVNPADRPSTLTRATWASAKQSKKG